MRTRDYQAFAGTDQRRGWKHTLLTVFATLVLGGLVLVLGGEPPPVPTAAEGGAERAVSPVPAAESEPQEEPCSRRLPEAREDALARKPPSGSPTEPLARDADGQNRPCSPGWPTETDVGLGHPTIH